MLSAEVTKNRLTMLMYDSNFNIDLVTDPVDVCVNNLQYEHLLWYSHERLCVGVLPCVMKIGLH